MVCMYISCGNYVPKILFKIFPPSLNMWVLKMTDVCSVWLVDYAFTSLPCHLVPK